MHMSAMDPMANTIPSSISGEGISVKNMAPKTAAAVGSPAAARIEAVPPSMRAMAVV